MANDKYGNIDELMGSTDQQEAPSTRKRNRPSPAIAATMGDRRPVSHTEKLKEERDQIAKTLDQEREKFEAERKQLQLELEEARRQAEQGHPIQLQMPETKTLVGFSYQILKTDLIDVSPVNERLQGLLDEIALSDILPSIRDKGQQEPGLLRPKADGRFELIAGSRRLAAVKIANQDYKGLVGDIPDADVRSLSVIENNSKDVSPYEKAMAYEKRIANSEFNNWTQLGYAYGFSSSQIARYRACAEIDEIFVRILPSPSDMTARYGEMIKSMLKKNREAMTAKAEELLKTRSACVDVKDVLDYDAVVKELKRSLKTQVVTPGPSTSKPVVYQSSNGEAQVTHSVRNDGAVKLEFNGVSEAEMEKVISAIKKTLKMK